MSLREGIKEWERMRDSKGLKVAQSNKKLEAMNSHNQPPL